MALQASDLILVNRASLTYKMVGSEILTPIATAQAKADAAMAQANTNKNDLATLSAGTFAVPTGGVVFVAIPPTNANWVPNGFLPCDGGTYSTTLYNDLFNLIGYTYGGSGASFNVPDLRERFIMGYASGGDAFGSKLASQNKSHFHEVNTTTAIQNPQNHTHTGDTNDNGAHAHTYTTYSVLSDVTPPGNANDFWQATDTNANTGNAGLHKHSYTTGNQSVDHTHALQFNTELEGGAEARPLSMPLLPVIKY